MKFLLASGAVMDVEEPHWNPLFAAIYDGHTDVARHLIESGIDTSVRYTGENTTDMDALTFAREWGRSEIVELLRKR